MTQITGWASHPKKSTMAVSMISLALAFNNPVGHDALYEAGLRVRFYDAWQTAREVTSRPLTFRQFRDNAQIYLMVHHNNDSRAMLDDMKLLAQKSPFCIPFSDDGDRQPQPPAYPVACHAAVSGDRKKELDKQLRVS